ncbi:MAG: hypothetical protein MUE42_15845 [Opitutaceae bacterium]|nr:hypothetical protein [Opitutaceae bacterium]
MKVTYYLETTSSWCHWAEPMWAELKQRYSGKVDFEWKIALMNPADFPDSREQCDWFYRRSGTVVRAPYRLNSGWLEPERKGDYRAPNLVAEAARDFGITDDRARLALSHAAMRDGRKVGDLTEAVAAVSAACGLDPAELRVSARRFSSKTRSATARCFPDWWPSPRSAPHSTRCSPTRRPTPPTPRISALRRRDRIASAGRHRRRPNHTDFGAEAAAIFMSSAWRPPPDRNRVA